MRIITADERAELFGVAYDTLFALFALTLAGLGVYGVIAVATAGRTREFGLRLALGARPGAVVTMVVRDALGLAALTAARPAGAVGAARWRRLRTSPGEGVCPQCGRYGNIHRRPTTGDLACTYRCWTDADFNAEGEQS